jgi:hypothetical protein
MPTLYRFPNGKIEIRTRDHLPPHVHVLLNDGREVLVHLADGQLVMRTAGAACRTGRGTGLDCGAHGRIA